MKIVRGKIKNGQSKIIHRRANHKILPKLKGNRIFCGTTVAVPTS